MNSKILKLEAPYNIIYAGGRIGKHIATLTVWNDDDMGVYGATQYPILDEGGELAAGALVTEAELQDCRVICNESDPRVKLRWLAKIVEYDMKQEEPVEFGYMWERLEMLGVKPIWDKAKNEDGEEYDQNVYEISISFDGTHDLMIAQSYTISGFYFYARGTVEEVYKELHYQHGIYESCFYNDHLVIKFKTPDGWERHIIDLLNADEESYTPAENEEELF
ncbi:MAG: hypothetical protein J6034_09885 [Bacteroidaceae bacterium]|nr:hypothetical protein [Bacteroidaceae bacterium]